VAEPIRITQVLDFFKEQWYVDWVVRVGKAEAKRTSTVAMAIGTAVDECIKTGKTTIKKHHEEVNNCLSAYKKWKEVYQPKSIVNGQRLFATIEGVEVSGEPDLFVDDVLVDIKCSTKISPKYWIQVNMYRQLHQSVGDVAILRLDKHTGSFEYVVRKHEPKLCGVWLGMLVAMLYLKGEEENGDEL